MKPAMGRGGVHYFESQNLPPINCPLIDDSYRRPHHGEEAAAGAEVVGGVGGKQEGGQLSHRQTDLPFGCLWTPTPRTRHKMVEGPPDCAVNNGSGYVIVRTIGKQAELFACWMAQVIADTESQSEAIDETASDVDML